MKKGSKYKNGRPLRRTAYQLLDGWEEESVTKISNVTEELNYRRTS